MEFVWSHPENPDFIMLTRELDACFTARLGEKKQASFDPYNHLQTLGDVVLVYAGERAVACGALKTHENGDAEIKRVYVQPAVRRAGLAKQILVALEEQARKSGCHRLVLETNPGFLEAVALYQGAGFTPIAPFEPYLGMETLCMAKTLEPCN